MVSICFVMVKLWLTITRLLKIWDGYDKDHKTLLRNIFLFEIDAYAILQ